MMKDQEAVDFLLEAYTREREEALRRGEVNENTILKKIAKGLDVLRWFLWCLLSSYFHNCRIFRFDQRSP